MADSGTTVETPPKPICVPQVPPISPWGQSPWGKTPSPDQSAPVSLMDVMSEQLAGELHQQEVTRVELVYDPPDPPDHEELLASIVGEASLGEDVDADFLLAQALQREYDRENELMMEKAKEKSSPDGKVSLSFDNYRSLRSDLGEDIDTDSDSDEEEFWVDREKDVVVKFDKRGLCGKGKNILTKHDATLCAMRNAKKVMNFPPSFVTGDVHGDDITINNRVYNQLKTHSIGEEKRRARLHEKKENATSEQAVDPKTRLMMYKLINANILESLSGIISTGKESVIFHGFGGGNKDVPVPLPTEVAIKVFKTTLNEFHTRSIYVKGDYRFSKDEFKKKNPRKIIKMWTEKELLNLRKLRRVGIRCPEPIMLRKHMLIMSFVGENQVPAMKLKDCELSEQEWKAAYDQTYKAMKMMYRDARLVHADLSGYNLLYLNGNVWVIDVSQAVDLAHPNSLEFLLRDCRNVSELFSERGVPHVPSQYQLFNSITGLHFEGEDSEFLLQIQDYENSELWLANDEQRTHYQFDYFFNKEVLKRSTTSSHTKSSSKRHQKHCDRD